MVIWLKKNELQEMMSVPGLEFGAIIPQVKF